MRIFLSCQLIDKKRCTKIFISELFIIVQRVINPNLHQQNKLWYNYTMKSYGQIITTYHNIHDFHRYDFSKYTLYDSILMKLIDRQNWFMVLEIKIMLTLGGLEARRAISETTGEKEMFLILIWVVVMGVFLYSHFHWAVHLKFINFIEVIH